MKASASRKSLQAKTHVPIGGKRHHTNQSRDLDTEEQGKLWEGRRWKSDSDTDGDRDNGSDSEFWELRDLLH